MILSAPCFSGAKVDLIWQKSTTRLLPIRHNTGSKQFWQKPYFRINFLRHEKTLSPHPIYWRKQHRDRLVRNGSREIVYGRHTLRYWFRLIDVGISALQTQVGERLFERFVEQELKELETFREFVLSR